MSDRLNQTSPALPQSELCLLSWMLFAVRALAPSCWPVEPLNPTRPF